MVANQTMEITAASQSAVEFFSDALRDTKQWLSQYASNIETINRGIREDLVSEKPMKPSQHFAEMTQRFEFAHADHSASFSPGHGGTDTGRGGPSGGRNA